MAKQFAKKFYNSAAWKKCKKSYVDWRISVDGGMCEKCRQRIGYILHHKEKLTPTNINNPDITLNWAMLSWECKQCHDREEGHWLDSKPTSELLCGFDENGQPIDQRDI